MQKTKICLCLTATTIEEDLKLIDTYRDWIDLVELRVDCLCDEDRQQIRQFPKLANLPVILTIRRICDGGFFEQGEGARTVLFARGLAFADTDPRNNFAYVDLEDDFHVSCIEESVQAFGIKIIRSHHDFEKPITNIRGLINTMSRHEEEICKIAFMAHSLADVTQLYKEAQLIGDREVILIAMGTFGQPSRILAGRFNSVITYTSVPNTKKKSAAPGQIGPIELQEKYGFRSIGEKTKLFAITGNPVTASQSPDIHNYGYREKGLDAAYITLNADSIEAAMFFAETVGITGLSVTHPFKHDVLPLLEEITADAGDIGASNTIIHQNGIWRGYNTDARGFSEALLAFLGRKNLKFTKVAIIGAGGAADAVAYAIKTLGGKACIFNRSVVHARDLAEKYNFAYAPLDDSAYYVLSDYSKVIIQATSVGMLPNENEDPLAFYNFEGYEYVMDLIYRPAQTKLMRRAADAGCKTTNGYQMLLNQARLQFKLFTGESYPPEGPQQ